ncbi:MAG: DUF420 domain-containing protein [Ignavibacteriales bacterium]|nr:DUF420 domain-containing protein [Ignavibacteriales bacterium]
MTATTLPALNAVLNMTAAILLLVGHRMMKKGRIDLHRKCMIGTFAVSCLFLISYLTYHSLYGSQSFWGDGWLRVGYLVILGTHSVCAAAIVPLAIVTLMRGLKRDDKRHATIARWTYPIWVYVSVTGVAIYLMLYQLKPDSGF